MRYTKWTLCLRPALVAIAALGLCCVLASRAQAQSAEDRLLVVLTSSASVAEKCNACRELQTAGTERSIPALAALLTDPAISHTARMALEVMPYPAAGAALREAVGKTAGLTRSGVIDSLGERRDAEAVPLLTGALTDQDAQVRAAAANALGKIGTPDATEALAAARAKAEPGDKTALGIAMVRCADRLWQAEQREKAAATYAALSQPGEDAVVRTAALRGRLQSAGPDAGPVIAQSLADDDPLVRQAAAGQLRNLSDGALRDVAAKMAGLRATERIAVLAAVRIRQDKSLAAVVLQTAGADDPVVRVAAIRALGVVGDAAALPLLIESSALGDAVGDAARHSLRRISAPGVDQEIAKRLRAEKDPARRAGWIELVEARRPAGAAALLLAEATHAHPDVRSRAMAALANLAGPKDVAKMASAVLRADKGAERDNAEKAVMLVCQQVPDPEKRAEPVIELLKKASPQDRAALLPLLGRIGGSAALSEVQSALKANSVELSEAGVRAICNWPDASVAEQLLDLSQNATSPAQRLWALRAFIRVIALPSDVADAKKLDLLKQAMQRAQRDDERTLILERAAAIRTVEALRFLLPYLDQPSLAQTAAASITELGRHKELRDPNKAEFIPALQQVLKVSKDATVQEQARRYIQAANEG